MPRLTYCIAGNERRYMPGMRQDFSRQCVVYTWDEQGLVLLYQLVNRGFLRCTVSTAGNRSPGSCLFRLGPARTEARMAVERLAAE